MSWLIAFAALWAGFLAGFGLAMLLAINAPDYDD